MHLIKPFEIQRKFFHLKGLKRQFERKKSPNRKKKNYKEMSLTRCSEYLTSYHTNTNPFFNYCEWGKTDMQSIQFYRKKALETD